MSKWPKTMVPVYSPSHSPKINIHERRGSGASSASGWLSDLRQVAAYSQPVSSFIKPESWSRWSLGTFWDVNKCAWSTTLIFKTSCLK